jgi:cytochrome P450
VLTLCISALAHHPDVENKIILELEEVLGTNDYPSFEDLGRLKYLGYFIKEIMRINPPGSSIRYVPKGERFGEFVLPEDSMVWINPYVIHRNPDHWEDPLR